MNNLPAPFKYRLTGPDALGFFRWQHIQEEEGGVYDRSFPNASQLLDYVENRYGKRFAKRIDSEIKAFGS